MATSPATLPIDDAQDPLPDPSWFFRRIALLGTLAVLLLLRAYEVIINGRAPDHWTDYLIMAVLVLYTVAPSAEQITKMIATVSLLKPGNLALTQSASTTTTDAGTDGAGASKTVTGATTIAPVAAAPPTTPEGLLLPEEDEDNPVVFEDLTKVEPPAAPLDPEPRVALAPPPPPKPSTGLVFTRPEPAVVPASPPVSNIQPVAAHPSVIDSGDVSGGEPAPRAAPPAPAPAAPDADEAAAELPASLKVQRP